MFAKKSKFQDIANFFHVLPNFPLLVGIAKKVSRMKRGHQFYAKVVLKAATQFCDADFRIQKILRRRVSHHNDHFGANNRDLPLEKRAARFGLGMCRLAVSRRTAAIDIADKYIFALHPDAFNDLRQKLPSSPDKRKSLLVLVRTRRSTPR